MKRTAIVAAICAEQNILESTDFLNVARFFACKDQMDLETTGGNVSTKVFQRKENIQSFEHNRIASNKSNIFKILSMEFWLLEFWYIILFDTRGVF